MPLTTIQGMAPEELIRRIGGRAVFIWGTGEVGLDVLTGLRRAGIAVKAFLHTRAQTAEAFGLPVIAADDVLARPNPGADAFVVIASVQYRKPAEAACQQAGLVRNDGYLCHLSMRRPVAVVEVANHHGRLATFGGRQVAAKPPAQMALADFERVLAKLWRDQPALCHVELSWFGDPMVNPELPDIVDHCERFVPCTVTTTLANPDNLDAVLAAQPSRFNIIAYGFGESYDAQMGGAAWSDFLDTLERLKTVAAATAGRTRFTLKYIRTKGEPRSHGERWHTLLQRTEIALSVELPYITPYDPLLSHCQRASLPDPARWWDDHLTWNLDHALALSAEDRDNPCLSQRLFPVIDADLSVGGCHLYEGYLLAPSYLSLDWADLLSRRHSSPFCVRCQGHGLHRLDIPVLVRRFPLRGPNLFTDCPS